MNKPKCQKNEPKRDEMINRKAICEKRRGDPDHSKRLISSPAQQGGREWVQTTLKVSVQETAQMSIN